MFLPVTVAGNRDGRVVAGNPFFRQKCTASRHWNAKNGEIIRGHDGTEGAARIALLADANQCEIEAHYVSEHRVLLANVEISGIGKAAKLLGILLVLRKKLDHLMRLGISRWGKKSVFTRLNTAVFT